MITKDDVAAFVKELQDNAARLGLTWILSAAQVADPTVPTVVFDSDTSATAVPVVNLLSDTAAGDRVYVAQIPPAGNYMIGRSPLPDPARMVPENTNAAAAAGTTTSATYVDMPGPPTVTITKVYPDTRLRVDFHATSFSTAVSTVARFAVNIDLAATDNDISGFTHNLANTHRQASGTGIYACPGTGTVIVTGRWRRVSGAGVLTMDTSDWVSMTVQEVI